MNLKMKNKAIIKISKIIIAMQLIIIVGTFVFVLFFTPHLDYPRDGEILQKQDIDFKFRNANVILIDDNKDFSSPSKINLKDIDNNKILFKSGIYYWKAIGIVESSIKEFTVNSNIGLELDVENESLKNVGDEILNVSLINNSRISGLVILDVDVEYGVEIENKTVYRGEQYEN